MTVATARWIATAVAFALALGLGACGGSDDDGAGDAVTSESASAEQQVRAVVRRVGDLYEARRPAAVCAAMTRRARAGLAALGRDAEQFTGASVEAVGGRVGCEQVMASVVNGKSIEDYRPKIVSTEIDGDRAIVTGDVAHDEKDQRAVLEREDGEWRVSKWFEN